MAGNKKSNDPSFELFEEIRDRSSNITNDLYKKFETMLNALRGDNPNLNLYTHEYIKKIKGESESLCKDFYNTLKKKIEKLDNKEEQNYRLNDLERTKKYLENYISGYTGWLEKELFEVLQEEKGSNEVTPIVEL